MVVDPVGRIACWLAFDAIIPKLTARLKWLASIYSQYSVRYESWSKFISDAYWNAELAD